MKDFYAKCYYYGRCPAFRENAVTDEQKKGEAKVDTELSKLLDHILTGKKSIWREGIPLF